MTKSTLIPNLLGLVLLASCDNEPRPVNLPEVNNENCQLEKIKQIEDQAARQEFAGLCSRQPVGIAPTDTPKNWLDLIDKK